MKYGFLAKYEADVFGVLKEVLDYVVSDDFAVVGAICGGVALFLTVLIALFIMPVGKEGKQKGLAKKLHNLFHFKKIYFADVMKFVYILLNFVLVFGGIAVAVMYFSTDWLNALIVGIGAAVLGPIALRVIFEFILALILLVQNMIEMNDQLREMKRDGIKINPADLKALTEAYAKAAEKSENREERKTAGNTLKEATASEEKKPTRISGEVPETASFTKTQAQAAARATVAAEPEVNVMTQTVEEATAAVTDATVKVAEDAEQKAEEATEEIKNAVEQQTEAVCETVSEEAKDLETFAEDVATEAAEQAKTVEEAVTEASEQAKTAEEVVTEQTEAMIDNISEEVADKTMTMVNDAISAAEENKEE